MNWRPSNTFTILLGAVCIAYMVFMFVILIPAADLQRQDFKDWCATKGGEAWHLRCYPKGSMIKEPT